MEKKQFQAESKRLLDLMIHSIYTNKEIFIREIISNASDAIDKRYFKASSNGETGLNKDDFEIRITPDIEANTLTISDTGIGMTKDELENNLGTIAQSGSLKFKTENNTKENDIDIIGQFGVGFYSAFMVSDKIEVTTKAMGSDTAYTWTSQGADGYSIEEAEKDSIGTEIVLTLHKDTDEEKYSEYLKEFKIRALVKKYSDYVRFPIVMNCEKKRPIEASEEEKAKEDYKVEYETYYEDERLNSMTPIWKRNKKDVTDEEYNNFYKEKFMDFEDPAKIISTNVEGLLSYNALLFIPNRVPFNYYSKDYQKGLQLYSSGVSIMEECSDLLPDYFGFVKGLVDSQDLSLNISREMLQQDRQLKAIGSRLEKKILSELLNMQKNDREAYDKFFENFGTPIKYGAYADFGQNKEKLQDLLMFHSSKENKLVTFKEYILRMQDEQKYIYYAVGENISKIDKMPQMEAIKDKNIEVLYCTNEVDEFALRILGTYEEKEFKNISEGDLDIEMSEEEKKDANEKNEASKDILEAIKKALGDKVVSVKLSTRLKNHPVCFASGEGLSIEMEKTLKSQAEASGDKSLNGLKAQKILEINGNHEVFESLKTAVEENNEDKIKDYSNLLYNQAMLIEGLEIEDPIEFSNLVCKLMK